MADVVDVGTGPNTGTGIDYRSAFVAINAAFASDRGQILGLSSTINTGVKQADLDSAIQSLEGLFGSKLDANGDGSQLKVTLSSGAVVGLVAALAALMPKAFLSLPGDPGPSDIPSSQHRLVLNTGTGQFARWANNNGVMVDLDAALAARFVTGTNLDT